MVLLVAGAILVASPVRAQSCSTSSSLLASLQTWSAPLDRPVSLHVRDISLRDALDRVSSDARIRLSYVSEAIPLDNRVCASFDAIPVGEALGLLLRGTPVLPISAGGEHVVLTPSETPGNSEQSERVPRVLDRVVVTGGAIEAPVRRLTVAMNVVSGAELSRYAEGNLAQALSDLVPGLWVWQSAPTSLVAHYGSIRGTSSFGSSYPKIYVDGIELANPLLITQFTPETVERIEVIRGPQGAALYGSDAISGVINIVTRHDGSNGGASTVARSAVGAASSAYMPRSAITQDHAITVREGSSAQSGSASFTSGGVGEYLPGAFARHTTGNAGFRLVRSRLIATGTARIFVSESADPSSPLFRDSVSATRIGQATPQSVQEYTLGGTATIVQSERWTHAIVAGFDGSRLMNLADYHTPLPSASGPDLGTAGGNANLGTLRLSSIARLGDADKLATTLTFSGENSLLDFRSQPDTVSVQTANGSAVAAVVRRWTSAGVAQANVSWRDAGYITAGLRVERNEALGSNRTVSMLPMLGAAVLHDYGLLTVKLRSAYGRGIRPATTSMRETAWFDPRGQARLLSLAPEEQSGIETGIDLYVGKTFGLQLTRYDQLASGLIQRVAYAAAGDPNQGPPPAGGYPQSPVAPEDRRISYLFQNVGQITNRGWEVKSDLNVASLALNGTFSTVDSRVRQVAQGYVGDLRVGDRMLEVPERTGSVSAAWTGGGWTTFVMASRSWDWIDYDRIALAGAFSNSAQTDAELVGQQLRNYWLKYSGVTRLRASIGRTLYRGLSLNLSGENLLNRQHGEPDNVTVVPGRTLSFGLRAVM